MSDVAISLTGQWAKARVLLKTAPERLHRAQTQATMQEAHALRKLIVEGLREQRPGGKPFASLQPLTLAIRKFQRFRGTKALLRRGDLRNNITVSTYGNGAVFVGIKRSARGRDGKGLVNVAEVQEFGTKRPIVIPVTDRVRAYYMAMYLAGATSAPLRPDTRVLVFRVPARPFMRPAFEQWRQGLEKRYAMRVAMILNGDFGRL